MTEEIPIPKNVQSLIAMEIGTLYAELKMEEGTVFLVDGKLFKQEKDGLTMKLGEEWIPVTIDFSKMDIRRRL